MGCWVLVQRGYDSDSPKAATSQRYKVQTPHMRHTRVTPRADFSLGCARCTDFLEYNKLGRCSGIIHTGTYNAHRQGCLSTL